jgi:microcystin degradation protein MlrC
MTSSAASGILCKEGSPSRKRRLLVGRIYHESHAFSPSITGADQFSELCGETMLRNADKNGTTLGGIITRATAQGLEIIPSLSISAPPGGLVDHDFYRSVRDELIGIAKANDFDAIALELHGAMATTQLPDAEGDLLTHLRIAVGPAMPIAIGLDLHAHLSDAMLEAVDICISCKENPHSDVVECGERLVDLLIAALRGELDPVMNVARVPMILPGAADTLCGPLAELHSKARRLTDANEGIWDISLFNVFPYSDDFGMGQAVVVVSNGRCARAVSAASEIASLFWEWRELFKDELPSIDEALDLVSARPDACPYILADVGDRVLGGAPGDSTAILSHALARGGDLRGAIPVTDAQSVHAARLAGVGTEVDLDIGGRATPGFRPLAIRGTVKSLGTGRFVIAGPFGGGDETTMGNTAVITVEDRLTVLLTSLPGFTHDPAAFTSQGVDLDDQDFLVVKSGFHFKLNFAGMGTPLRLATPGISHYQPGILPWSRARFWPEHDVTFSIITCRVHHRGTTLDHALANRVGA